MAIIKRQGKKNQTSYAVKVRRSGKQVWVGTFKTHDEARRAEACAIIEAGGSWPSHAYLGSSTGTQETCDEFAGHWTRDYPRARESTNRHNRNQVKKFGEDFAGVPLCAVTRKAARAWARDNQSRHSAVRAMFSDAANEGLCLHNPFTNLRLPQSEGRKHLVVLTPAEVAQLAATARAVHGAYGHEFAALILFAAYTGMRPMEITALEWDDIDFAADEIDVTKTLSAGEKTMLVTRPKNGKTRRIVLPPQARDALHRIPRRLDTRRIFSTINGRRFSKSTFHYAWHPVRTAFGRPTMAFYELRHFACTYLLDELGLSAADTAHQLGHTDGGLLVMKLYGHPSADRTRERIKQAFARGRADATTPSAQDGSEARLSLTPLPPPQADVGQAEQA